MTIALSHNLVIDVRPVARFLSPQSFALMATGPDVNRATIFVHGFGGDSHKTWEKFHDLIVTSPEWETTDAYFISYDSIDDEISLSATYLADFVMRIIPDPPIDLLAQDDGQTPVREVPGRYAQLCIVAHSEGGVVARLMLLELIRRTLLRFGHLDPARLSATDQTVASTDLRLFAPALAGARLAGNAGRLANTLGLSTLLSIYRGGSPAFQELSQDSQLLRSLRDDTNYFAAKHSSVSALRATIVWAQRDRIVVSLPYRYDTSFRLLRSTHSSVCKPGTVSSSSFRFVTGAVDFEDLL